MTKKDKRQIRNRNRKELTEDNWGCCVNCFSTKDLEIHHIVPLANGGNNTPFNTVTLCHDCHLKAHGKLKQIEDAKRGGRKPIEMKSDYDKIINQYLIGAIDRTEMIKALGFSDKVKLDSIKPYQEYLKEHHIVKVISNVARNKNPHFHGYNELTVIYFDDGRKKSCCRGIDGKIQVIVSN